MVISQLVSLMDETGLSAEDLAPALGVSNMTLRRWRERPGSRAIPKGQRRSIVEGIYQLVLDGRLRSDCPIVKKILKESSSVSFQAIVHELGISAETLTSNRGYEEKVVVALSQIGINDRHRQEVDKSSKKLSGFKKLGAEWKRRISLLVSVIRSAKLSVLDKWVAYGALFYLIMPFDLIPDHIPVVGLLDDFAILGIAVAYYVKRFPTLFAGA